MSIRLTKMNFKKIISVLALLLSILSTILIWHDSQKSVSALAKIINELTLTIGFWQDDPMDPVKVNEFKDSIQRASNLDIKGFILLMIGFALQLITMDFSDIRKWFLRK